ncbi:MAG: ATP-binding cassette domain-containing protein [Oceanospirillaceae bacterium]|nr:ATP-binding cassette domain-containing protein [Oceanospirillaceae bacterium]MCP5335260.1 ATP-binding cassette domain-containing protein [Oceanospirillaceae bacterium]MCP5350424.1 ATP-binding cassette domain-containing protein [Oceanospirillaceae bacterium]
MIRLQQISLQRGTKALLNNADLTIHDSHKLAIVGANGAGKSSLFKLLLGELHQDLGELYIPVNWRIAHMAQEVKGSEQSALDYVLDGHKVYRDISNAIIKAEQEHQDTELARLHGEFELIRGYQVSPMAAQMLAGLGFLQSDLQRPVADFSGGWRMRLNLARALIMPSDLLLLDEPTNHLDLDASLWLENWLQQYAGTLLLISHDRDFIDEVTNGIVHVHDLQLTYYSGNYAAFENRRAERLAQQQSMYEQQQAQIAHLESFINRFKAKASKAKQAQSRVKALARMEVIAQAHVDSPFHFTFPNPNKQSDPLVSLNKAGIGYGQPLLSLEKLALRPGDRIGLLGPNGAGKSTLIKTLVGDLPLLSGQRSTGEYLGVGYFAQHQLDAIDTSVSPMDQLQRMNPDADEQSIRNFLGGFGFHGDQTTEKCDSFSGGELARLALARVAWLRPNLLVLDEPTNHLDLEMRHALTMALQDYEGAIVVVSHDRHLLSNTVDGFWLVADGAVREFEGDLDDYKLWLRQRQQALNNQGKTASSSDNDNSAEARKEKKRRDAEIRQQLSPLKKQVEKLEAAMEKTQAALAAVEAKLADADIYSDSRKAELQTALAEQIKLSKTLADTEEEWMLKLEELETLQSQLQE